MRYFVTYPILDNDAWFNVRDSQFTFPSGEPEPNFSLASFSKFLPDAKLEAEALCFRLNFVNTPAGDYSKGHKSAWPEGLTGWAPPTLRKSKPPK